jgi:hypothetical protein
MFSLALAAVVAFSTALGHAQTSTSEPSEQPSPIVVEGKPKPKAKLVCTSVKITGSRVGRSTRCVTSQQAAEELERSREAMRDAATNARVADSLACGGKSIKMCN